MTAFMKSAISFKISVLFLFSLLIPVGATASDGHEIVFIGSAVRDAQVLINSIRPGMEVVKLDVGRDGVAQVAEVLAARRKLKAIHIISHGAPGKVLLGKAMLSAETLSEYGAEMKKISRSLVKGGDILLYGCNVARDSEGKAFVEEVATVTGANVAASDNLTGSALRGGDWVLEERAGNVQTKSLSVPGYKHLLTLPNGQQDIGGTFTTHVGPGTSAYGGATDYAEWDSTWAKLTYDGGTLGGVATAGIEMLGPSAGCYINVVSSFDPGTDTNTDINTHWFRVTADNVNVSSFRLTDITISYYEPVNFDITVVGTLAGGGTITAGPFNFNPGDTANHSIWSNISSVFNGQQITSFQLKYMTNGGYAIGDFTFMSFSISNATAATPPPR